MMGGGYHAGYACEGEPRVRGLLSNDELTNGSGDVFSELRGGDPASDPPAALFDSSLALTDEKMRNTTAMSKLSTMKCEVINRRMKNRKARGCETRDVSCHTEFQSSPVATMNTVSKAFVIESKL